MTIKAFSPRRHAILAFGAVTLLLALANPAAAQIRPSIAAVTFAPDKAAQPGGQLTVKDWIHQPTMISGKVRDDLAKRGFKFDAYWTQFFQSSPDTGDTRVWDYGGKLDAKMTQDFSNMGFEGVTGTAHVAFRYGDVPLLAGGTFVPTNSALLFPENEGASARVTSFYLTKMFGTNTMIQAGRFDNLDRYDHTFTGGDGIDKFNNLAFVLPPLYARTIPPVAEGVFFTTLKDAEPFVTVGLLESTEKGFFKNGATFYASVALPYKFFDTPSHYVFNATISSTTLTSLDQSPYVFIPALNAPLATESNAWTFDFTFDQYLVWDPTTKTGFGLFGMIGASDSNPSPVDIFGHIGVGGTSPIPNRSQDNFGVGYYFNGISNTLEDTLSPLIRTRDENGFEGFYNFAVTGWSKVSADVQFIDPFAVGSKTRGFFSIRWKMVF